MKREGVSAILQHATAGVLSVPSQQLHASAVPPAPAPKVKAPAPAASAVGKVGTEWLSEVEVAGILGLSGRTIRRWVDGGQFPKPYYLAKRVRKWRRREVDDWLLSRPRDAE
jgi:predicted DNA-binding transcriptional regulator AlpA